MVLMDYLDEAFGYGEMAGLIVGGALLVLLGLGHVVMPATSVVGGLVSMLDGVSVSSSLGNVPGLVVRAVGLFVALLGWDILMEGMN